MDRCFRREQSEGADRLMSYHSASCVIADDNLSVDDGMAVAEGLLTQFGFQNFRFIPDDKGLPSPLAPGPRTEVYAFHPGLVGSGTSTPADGLVATFGIYSPTAIAPIDILPVMNLGLGVRG